MKQKFKHKVYTTSKVVNNILSIYNQAETGHNWYKEAHRFASDLAFYELWIPNKDILEYTERPYFYEVCARKVCGIIAALSPLKSWEENKKITITFLKHGDGKHIKLFKDKAQAILDSDGEVETIADILNGNKITSFFLNILDPDTSQAVTVDRHAISIAVGETLQGDNLNISAKQYEFFANAYRVAGAKVGVSPLQMQSVTWVKWRELKNEKKYEDVPF